MILRKPYALLIRYFQRIHLVLLAISVYLFYKITALRTFVGEFIQTESYNKYIEPIENYISGFTYFLILLILVAVVILIVLLHHKKKPWKIYLFPFLEYIFLFGILMYTKNFFDNYNELSSMTTIMAARDLLVLAYYPQFLIFLLFGIRFLGIDVKKFGFKEDEEYLDIKEEDREEVEVSFEFDKDKIKRTVKKLFRNIRYVYYEHRLIFHTIIIIIVVSISGYTYYYFGILHKTYKEGNYFTGNSYQIKVNKSYLTDRKMNGDLLEKKSKYAYVIVNLTVKNPVAARQMNIDRFRLMNRNKEGKMVLNYGIYFSEFGSVYDNREFKAGETRTFTLIFQVEKDLKKNKFVLYYQNIAGDLLIKKTALKVEDLRELSVEKEVKLNEELLIDKQDFTFVDYKIVPTTTYSSYKCDTNGCGIKSTEVSSYGNYILELSYVSDTFDGKDFIDYSVKYAKVNYEDKNGKKKSIAVESAVTTNYTSNSLYIKVPQEITEGKNISLIYTKRNKQYYYHLN